MRLALAIAANTSKPEDVNEDKCFKNEILIAVCLCRGKMCLAFSCQMVLAGQNKEVCPWVR